MLLVAFPGGDCGKLRSEPRSIELADLGVGVAEGIVAMVETVGLLLEYALHWGGRSGKLTAGRGIVDEVTVEDTDSLRRENAPSRKACRRSRHRCCAP